MWFYIIIAVVIGFIGGYAAAMRRVVKDKVLKDNS